jgi:drug/metabolite transporter (DMT)-like permease
MNRASAPAERRPAAWAIVLAFAIVYLTWGTTYFAIKEGVRTLPPALFGGVRIGSAGLVLLAGLWLRGESLRLARRDLLVVAASGVLHFMGGNGLITFAEQTVDSGAASVLAATAPVWIGLGETLWPRGERLTLRGWVGVLIGLVGVLVLLAPNLRTPAAFLADAGPLLVLASAMCWSTGSLVLRHGRPAVSHVVSAAYQMTLGGVGLALVGVLTGETGRLTADSLTVGAVWSFFYLMIASSLVAYVAYTWLLQHVAAPLVGTYAYVNPAVAVVVGWLLGGERVTGWLVGGLVVILTGVALVRSGGKEKVGVPEEPAGEEVSPRIVPGWPKSAGSPAPD